MRRLAVLALVLALPLGAAQSAQKELFVGNYTNPPNFGFDFVEDVRRNSSGGDGDCASSYNSYFLKATDSNFAYVAKDLDDLGTWGAKDSYKAAFRIKACQSDGFESGVAAVFSFEDLTPSAATKGDGKTTGAFANAVKVKFHENGNNWKLTLTQVVNGEETNLATGSTAESNEHRLFHFLVDNTDGGPRIQLQDYAGSPILTVPTDFAGRAVHSLWYVGYGFGGFEREVILVAQAPSTRIYDTDPRPPDVQGVSFLPSIVGNGDAVEVTAQVADDWGLDHVTLVYTINGGSNNAVAMTHQGGSAYRAQIPGQSTGTVVRFRIEATDTTGLVGHSDREYNYEVGSGDPVDDTDDNPNKPTDPGGGGIQSSGFRIGVFFGAALIGLASILLGKYVQDNMGKRALGNAISVAGLAFAAGYGIIAGNIGGIRSTLSDFPAFAWWALAIVTGLGTVLWFKRKGKRRPA